MDAKKTTTYCFTGLIPGALASFINLTSSVWIPISQERTSPSTTLQPKASAIASSRLTAMAARPTTAVSRGKSCRGVRASSKFARGKRDRTFSISNGFPGFAMARSRLRHMDQKTSTQLQNYPSPLPRRHTAACVSARCAAAPTVPTPAL